MADEESWKRAHHKADVFKFVSEELSQAIRECEKQ